MNIKLNALLQLNTIWVSCQGENPLDRENIGPIHYVPRNRGFPGYFYPFENNEGYLSPLLAIHLERPKSKCYSQIGEKKNYRGSVSPSSPVKLRTNYTNRYSRSLTKTDVKLN